ncbi:MAG: hypothetical protein ABJ056_06210 [Halioglobus sp.]
MAGPRLNRFIHVRVCLIRTLAVATATVRCSLRLGSRQQQGRLLVGKNVLVPMMLATIETSRTSSRDASLHAVIFEPLPLAEKLGDKVIWNGVIDGRNGVDDGNE